MSITSNIANVAYLLYTGANIPNLNADYLDNQTGTYYTDKSNTALSLAQTALDAANNVGPGAQIQPAFDKANSAYLVATSASSNTIYLQGALDQTNTNIISANNSLRLYCESNTGSALAASKVYTDTANAAISANTSAINTFTQSAYNQANNAISNASNAVTNASNAVTLAQSAYNNSNTKFSSSGGTITGNVTVSGSLQIDANLIVGGTVTTINANNLSIVDNMVYLNRGANVANPDIGIAGAYNDGIYHHCGFFRDASDGVWKVFDNYLPEPDESPYIDTSNSSFRIASFQANTITATSFSGSGASLTSLTAGNLSGTIPSGVLGNSNTYIGTTAIALNRSSVPQTLTGVNIDGTASNITAYTIDQNVGTSNSPRFANLYLGGPPSRTLQLYATGYNTGGGTGYHDFFGVTNSYGSATNPNKYFRLDSVGTLQIINSTYSQSILSLTDGGALNISGNISQNGSQVVTAGNYNTIITSISGSAGTFTSTSQNSQFNSIGVGTAGSGTAGEIRATNNITAYYSDDRLKTRLGNIENALNKIRSLQGFYYEANDLAQSMGYKPVREVGLSAQDTQRNMPEIVKPAPIDDKYLTVQYERYAPFIVEAIKELADQIDEIKNHLGI